MQKEGGKDAGGWDNLPIQLPAGALLPLSRFLSHADGAKEPPAKKKTVR